MLGDRFDDFAKRATKSVHLANDIQETAVRAGRLLIEAIDANAFPQTHIQQNGEWWDRCRGRVPGGVIAVVQNIEWPKGEPLPGDRPEYLEEVRKLSQPRQFTACWIFAIGSWLVRRFPSRFRDGAAKYDFADIAMDNEGNVLGKDGKPLRRRWLKDGQPLPGDSVLIHDCPEGWDKSDLDGEIAFRHDFYDEADCLVRFQVRAEVYADACRVLADLIRQRSPKPRSKRQKRSEWLAEAMLTVRDHPDWSDTKIARQVVTHRSALSRSPEYQRAASLARGSKDDLRKGYIKVDPETGQQDVEAYEDDLDDSD